MIEGGWKRRGRGGSEELSEGGGRSQLMRPDIGRNASCTVARAEKWLVHCSWIRGKNNGLGKWEWERGGKGSNERREEACICIGYM